MRMLGDSTVTRKTRRAKQRGEGQPHQQMVNLRLAGYHVLEHFLVSQGTEMSTPREVYAVRRYLNISL